MDEMTRRAVVAGGAGTAATVAVPLGSETGAAAVGADGDDDLAADVEGEDTGDQWGTYLGTGRRSELGADLEMDDEVGVNWRLDVSSLDSSPVAANGTAFLGDGSERLLAIDVGSGSVSWAADVDGTVTLAPATDGSHVVVGTDEGIVAAFDAEDGSEQWARGLNTHASTPAVRDGVAYVGGKDGTVAAFDIASGEVEWRTTIEVASENRFEHVLQLPTPVLADDRIVVNATDLVALDPSDGSTIWTTEVVRDSGLDDVWPTMPALTGDSIYLQLRTEIRRYDLESGVERWRTVPEFARHGAHPVSATDDAVVTAHIAGTNLYDPSRYYCLDPADGTIRWEFEDDDTGGAMSVGETEAYVPSRGDLVTLDLESGFENDRVSVDDAEHVENGRHINSGPVVPDAGSLVFQHGGTVYALSEDEDGSGDAVDADGDSDGSGTDDGSGTTDGDGEDTDASGSGSTVEDDVAVESDDDEPSLVTRARIRLASDVVYLISATVGAIVALARGRRYFGGEKK